MSNEKKNQSSSDDHIMALDPMEHVRLRPEIYVGGRDSKALNNLFNEMIDYVIHHARSNVECSVAISLLGPQTLSFRDNSSILPLQEKTSRDRTLLESMMTVIGVGAPGDFVIEGERSGLPFLTIPTPLSREVKVEVRRDGVLCEQNYRRGHKTDNLTYIRDLTPDEEHGTAFTFTIDDEIFGDAAFDVDWIERRLFEVACLLPDLKISFQNDMTGQRISYYAPNGIAHYITHLNGLETALQPPMILHMHHRMRVVDQRRTWPFEVDVAMQFLSTPSGNIYSFVKGLEIVKQGPHAVACFAALTDMLLGHSSLIILEDLPNLFLHVTLVINLWSAQVSFQSQTDRTLLNRDIHQPIYEELTLALLLYFREHPDCMPQLEALVMENRKQRHARRRSMRLI